MPWDIVRDVGCPNKFRLASHSSTCCADKLHAILIVRFFYFFFFFKQKNIFFAFRGLFCGTLWKFFKCKKMFPAGTPPWGMSKRALLRKIYFFFQPNFKVLFSRIETALPKSYILRICLSESQSAAQPQRRLPCGLSMAMAGFMIEQKQTRHTVQCS